MPSQIVAQNQFPANQNSTYNRWTPPNTQNTNPQLTRDFGSQFNPQNSLTDDQSLPIKANFPESALPFDAGVRTADFEAPVLDANGTMASKIDSAAATMGEWKDIAGEKASSWFSGLSSEGNWMQDIKGFFKSSGTSKVIGSLALVLGFYFLFVWVTRKLNPLGNAGLPSEVLEVLGQVPFGPKRSLQMVRLGPKLLLLLNSPEGTQPLGEITDPEEVEYLASLCQKKTSPRPTRRSPEPRMSLSTQAASLATQALPQSVTQNITQSIPQSAPQSAPQGIGTTNLNDVIRLLQQANSPNHSFEA